MIVVDTNLLVHLVLPSAETPVAEAVLRTDPDWAAPPRWRSDLRNVASLRARAGRLDVDGACTLFARAEAVIAAREPPVSTPDVLRLAAASGCTAYDCELVAVARDLGVSLVTSDRALLRAFPDTAVSPAALTSRFGSHPP